MNEWTARTLTSVSMIVLAGFTFYFTGSFWLIFLILLLLPSMRTEGKVSNDDKQCIWKIDNDFNLWESDCGLVWEMTDHDTPTEKEMNCCPKCGRKLVTKSEHT